MAKNIQDYATQTQPSPRQSLIDCYTRVRHFTEQLCVPLETEDYVIQSMPDVSPTRWHLAHTAWFFETFLLSPNVADYASPHPQYAYLFNSYYNSVGERHNRSQRGLISRPTVSETYTYRHYVDQCVTDFLASCDEQLLEKITPVLTLGIHHEQQHQELMVTDIKHVLSCNPLYPAYHEQIPQKTAQVPPLEWISYPEQLAWIGYQGQDFSYDNEGPVHRQFVDAYQLASRLITNREYLDFMQDGGYQNPLLWLSSGWNTVQAEHWQAPLYWIKQDHDWYVMTLSGLRLVDPDEPVCHVSYYEADAYARWAKARLATEAEWEIAASHLPITGNFAEQRTFHPEPLSTLLTSDQPAQMFGDVWEWTQSAYLPYHGYQPAPGALGEYNGKFMCNQFVLRGGSCATSITHIRPTYRNFFPPDARWQFMGIRLAREV
ncbi:ergothioneine biosynthesis protein EgtB [Dictyobacter arantiisoli]|uniref:Ergothioneine biosynthesis protein EgtB n=1 Tax=Dictyobacter arantiisoli TaxID=2014874 RepID=A0A5A5TDA0_9CHLR|nr:ergothioneine biosynthesis protein EgtB [Dictyobacter arantiisoli]GCF09510.1 ergothioneine biosynthesis protein EgtB [Dictyobacter arantiisoli]